MAEIDNRIKDVAGFFKKNAVLLQLAALVIIILIGVFIRVQPLDRLVDTTTGDYISIELDSTIFLKYAEHIAENDELFDVDQDRNYPSGADITNMGIFTSFFIAYLYKFLHIFSSSITVAYTDVIYPIIATAILSIFMFLLVRRIFDYKVALLSTLFINIIPSFMFRSLGGSSDHDILVMMFVIMTLYFFVAAIQSKKLYNNIIFGVIAGVSTFLGKYSGGAATFVLLIIGVASLIAILFNRFDKKDFYVYSSWILSFTLLVLFFRIDSISSYINSLSTMPAYLAFFIMVVSVYVVKKDLFNIKTIFGKKLPEGVISSLLALLAGAFFMLVIYGPVFFVDKINQVISFIFHFYSSTRWTLTVAENRRPYIIDWVNQFGWIYLMSFLAGIILLFYKSINFIKSKIKLTAGFGLFIFAYVFSRYSPNSILNGDTTFSRFLFYGSFILFFIFLIYFYMKSFYRDTEDYHNIAKINYNYLIIFIWFFVLVLGATGAIRLLFEFSPITAILSAFFFVFLFDYFSLHKNKLLKYAGVLLIIFVIFSPFAFSKGIAVNYYNRSYDQATHAGPGYNIQWQTAGKWVRENTPEGSVFAHWWDYGYWVQAGFDRPTMLDGGNMYGWWNYLMARNVLTAQNYTEPLKYLYTHNASYLLTLVDDVGKYSAYSNIGGDKNYDRFSYMTTFTLDPSSSIETRNGSLLFYRGVYPLDQDIVYNGKVYPSGSAAIGGVVVPLIIEKQEIDNKTLESTGVQQPSVILVDGNNQVELTISCIYVDNKRLDFENYHYKACFRIIPVVQNNQVFNLGAGLFISNKVVDSLFARLYLFNEHPQNYELVYDDSSAWAPVAIYNGNLVGPMKIWKINYPEDIVLTEEEKEYYLMRDYPDPELFQL